MRVPYRDLRVEDPALKAALLAAVDRVLSHGQLIMGLEVEAFEARMAALCSKRYAVGVSSGTSALHLSLRARNIGAGDEVITTPLSWIATINAIHLAGASPVFVDIAEDQNINPALIARAITRRTKAILPVHYSGKICDMTTVMAVAKAHGLLVIEDASQAYGACIDGRVAGSFGDLNCFSLNPMKVLPAYGEAGVIVTDDRDAYDRLMALRHLGMGTNQVCVDPALNSKIDALQAAMIMVSLERSVKPCIERRRDIARFYNRELAGVVECPEPQVDERHVYYTYVIRTRRRDELRAHLEARGIETKIHHPLLLSQQPVYAGLPRFDLPVAERVVKEIVSIPNHEKMTAPQLQYVVAAIREFFREGGTHV